MRALTLALALILSGSPLTAQEWTPEQQGLIDHITACWDAVRSRDARRRESVSVTLRATPLLAHAAIGSDPGEP